MDNLISLLSLIPDVVMIASIICAVTPTPKDDAILAKVYKILELLDVLGLKLNDPSKLTDSVEPTDSTEPPEITGTNLPSIKKYCIIIYNLQL